MEVDTLPKALIHITGLDPGRVAMRHKELGIWHDTSWAEYLGKVKETALGMNNVPFDKVADVRDPGTGCTLPA